MTGARDNSEKKIIPDVVPADGDVATYDEETDAFVPRTSGSTVTIPFTTFDTDALHEDITLELYKMGRVVVLHLAEGLVTPSVTALLKKSGIIPAEYRPSVDVMLPLAIAPNDTPTMGLLQVASNGDIIFRLIDGNNPTIGQDFSWQEVCLTWLSDT